jgi:hypothetical protein
MLCEGKSVFLKNNIVTTVTWKDIRSCTYPEHVWKAYGKSHIRGYMCVCQATNRVHIEKLYPE